MAQFLFFKLWKHLRDQACQIQIYKTRSWPGDSYLKSGENPGDFYRNQEAFQLSFFEENWNFRFRKWLIFSSDTLIMAKFFYVILYIYIYIYIVWCSCSFFLFSFFYLILMIQNVAKCRSKQNIRKPGETRRKSPKPAPGTRRFFNQEKSLKTRRLLV